MPEHRDSSRKRRTFFLLLTGGILLAFTFFRSERTGGWDDAYYQAQLTSVIGDGDLLLQDDLLAMEGPLALRLGTILVTFPDGALKNTFGIGPAMVHSSYLWPVVLATSSLHGVYRHLMALGSMALLTLMVLCTVELLRILGHEGPYAPASAMLSVLLGPLLFYGSRGYMEAHLPAAACASLLLTLAASWCERGGLTLALALGLSAGCLAALRWQDVLVAAAIVPALVTALRAAPAGRRRTRVMELLAGALLSTFPVAVQLLAFRVQYGRAWLVPQGAGYMRFTRPALASFLASPFHGALPWAPGFMAGLLALGFAWLGHAGWRRAFLAGLALLLPVFVYVSAAPRDWWGGESFGPRRLSTLAPAAAIGLATLARRIPRVVTVPLALLLVSWAIVCESAYLWGYDDLALLFAHSPSRDNPRDPSHHAAAGFGDPWGPLYALKPGFTFADAPRDRDRMIGLLAVAALVSGTCAVWQALLRSERLRRLALACGIAWCAVWVVLVVRAPANRDANRGWLAIARGRTADLNGLPRGPRAAAEVVLAAHAIREGRDLDAARHLAFSAVPDFPAVDPEELERFVRSADGERLLMQGVR